MSEKKSLQEKRLNLIHEYNDHLRHCKNILAGKVHENFHAAMDYGRKIMSKIHETEKKLREHK